MTDPRTESPSLRELLLAMPQEHSCLSLLEMVVQVLPQPAMICGFDLDKVTEVTFIWRGTVFVVDENGAVWERQEEGMYRTKTNESLLVEALLAQVARMSSSSSRCSSASREDSSTVEDGG